MNNNNEINNFLEDIDVDDIPDIPDISNNLNKYDFGEEFINQDNFNTNNNQNIYNNIQHNYDGWNDINFRSSQFMAKLYAVKKKLKFKYKKDDTITLPLFESERLLTQYNMFVEISNQLIGQANISVIAKVTNFDADPRTVQLPEWMFDYLNIKENNLIKLTTKKILNITKICARCPKEITDSLTIMEFEIRDRNILYKNDVIIVKMFEKEYKFFVDKLYNGDSEISSGLLYPDGIFTEIFFDITQY